MATDVLFVDPLSLNEFRRTLQARLSEATTALDALTRTEQPADAAGPPRLGTFLDARRTTGRHEALRAEYVARLRSLIDSLTAIVAGTDWIIDKYRTVDELNAADVRAVADAMRGARRERDDGRSDA